MSSSALLKNIKPIGIPNKYGRKKKNFNINDYLNIPKAFLEMFVGIIDGDGYFYIGKTKKDYIKINLSLILDIKEISMVKDIQDTLQMGKIQVFKNKRNWESASLIINKTDLQELLLPLLRAYNIRFLTSNRINQYDKIVYIFENNIKNYSQIPGKKLTSEQYIINKEPLTKCNYITLPYFKNWIVGFTIAEGSFFIKTNNDACFSLKQKLQSSELFEAINLVFNSKRKITVNKGHYQFQFTVSSKSDIQQVINFFSFSGHHSLLGNKLLIYNMWLTDLKKSKRYFNLNFPV